MARGDGHERVLWATVTLALACGPGAGGAGPTPTAPPDAAPAASDARAEDAAAPRFTYPTAERVDVSDDYHGVTVADPYRWLEQIDAPRTQAWVRAQNELTFEYLDGIAARADIRARMTELWDFERWDVPRRYGARYFVRRNDGLQDQSVLYTMDRLDAEPRPLLDPNTLSSDGTVALTDVSVSEDGAYMAYGTSASGSDWQTWRVRHVKTGEDLSDRIDWIKFSSVSWTKDGQGFFYAAYDPPAAGDELEDVNYDQKVYYHRLGAAQADDALVYARPDHKEWGFSPRVTEDGKYLVITVRIGTERRNGVYVQRLPARGPGAGAGRAGAGGAGEPRASRAPRAPRAPRAVVPMFEAHYAFVGNDGPVLYFHTDHDADRGQLVAVDIRKPVEGNRRTVVPTSARTLRGAILVGDTFVLDYLEDAHSRLERFDRKGRALGPVPLPGLGSVSELSGRRRDRELFFRYSSFTTPSTIYRLDAKTGRSEVFRAPKVAFSADDYVTEQVFFESRDGTRIPMFLSRRKDVELDAETPTYLYGYGGFNIPITPSFSVPNLVWMEMGGLFAVATLRGGGEYGEAWHAAGTKLRKQNVFDDFIGAAEWLVERGYTSSPKLAIGGRSNGGLLVGACMTQRPELFAAALPGVGVMDMLRFNRFTIGWAWESDYGSPQDPAQFTALRAYSPYHNLRSGTRYPATLVYTADHDDRVVPGHSYKFAAALQHAHAGEAPVMIRIDTKSGHGAGKPTSKRIEEWTDLWGFLVENLHMRPRTPT